MKKLQNHFPALADEDLAGEISSHQMQAAFGINQQQLLQMMDPKKAFPEKLNIRKAFDESERGTVIPASRMGWPPLKFEKLVEVLVEAKKRIGQGKQGKTASED